MANEVSGTLRKALTTLTKEGAQIDRQISAIETALRALGGQRGTKAPRKSKRMSAAARKAIGKRMKAYWAKRRAGTKSKAKSGGS